jgi:hypothetical protein
MANFEKVKMATSKSIRFLSSKRDSIVFLILLIVWTCLLFVFKKPDHQSDTVQIICNDKIYINHPMASPERIECKQCCLFFGLIWSSVNFASIDFLNEWGKIKKRTTFLKFCYRPLLWIATLLTGLVLVWMWSNNRYYSERLAPNFLAACRPLDLFCSPDSIVRVKCTTPAGMWMPALSDSLPKLAAIQAYLMMITFVKMAHFVLLAVSNTQMEFRVASIVWGLVVLVINVAVTLASACLIINCNDASVNIDFVFGYIKSAIVAGFWLLGEYYWRQSGIEDPTLPRHWNDPIPPQTGQIPTNLTPTPLTSLDEPLAATGSATGETENVYHTIYPNLPPEDENPPRYEDLVTRY